MQPGVYSFSHKLIIPVIAFVNFEFHFRQGKVGRSFRNTFNTFFFHFFFFFFPFFPFQFTISVLHLHVHYRLIRPHLLWILQATISWYEAEEILRPPREDCHKYCSPSYCRGERTIQFKLAEIPLILWSPEAMEFKLLFPVTMVNRSSQHVCTCNDKPVKQNMK